MNSCGPISSPLWGFAFLGRDRLPHQDPTRPQRSDVLEALSSEHAEGAEPPPFRDGGHLLGHDGKRLDGATTLSPDRLERGAQRELRDALPSMAFRHEEARDPPERVRLVGHGGLAVGPSRVDPREFLPLPVLTPADRDLAVVDEDRMGAALADERLLVLSIQRAALFRRQPATDRPRPLVEDAPAFPLLDREHREVAEGPCAQLSRRVRHRRPAPSVPDPAQKRVPERPSGRRLRLLLRGRFPHGLREHFQRLLAPEFLPGNRDRVFAYETTEADVVPGMLERRDEPLEGQVPERIRGDELGDLRHGLLIRDELVPRLHVDPEVAREPYRRASDPDVDLLRAGLPQALDDLADRRAADDRVVDQDNPFVLHRRSDRVQLEHDADLTVLLVRHDERSLDVP